MSFFPIGPNSATGHTSTLMAVENSINFALRLIKPILQGNATAVDVNPDAEKQYIDQIQSDLQQTVWLSGGCNNWYNRAQDGSRYNGMSYPYSQPYFWYRCLFPIYKDFKYDVSLDLCFSFCSPLNVACFAQAGMSRPKR